MTKAKPNAIIRAGDCVLRNLTISIHVLLSIDSRHQSVLFTVLYVLTIHQISLFISSPYIPLNYSDNNNTSSVNNQQRFEIGHHLLMDFSSVFSNRKKSRREHFISQASQVEMVVLIMVLQLSTLITLDYHQLRFDSNLMYHNFYTDE